MSTSRTDRCDQNELTCAYALQALPTSEVPAIQAHIATCPDCQRELESLRPVVNRLISWPTDVLRPTTSLQERLALRISEETGRQPVLPPVRRWSEPEWEQRHLKALAELFKQVLHLCEKAGLVKLGHVALDGTKIKANASKHKAMSYARMEDRATELETEVAKWLSTAAAADAEEDKLHGRDKTGEEMPDWVADKQRRREDPPGAGQAELQRTSRRRKLAKNPDFILR